MTEGQQRVECGGRTSISARSLHAIATRLASEAARTRDSDVSLNLSDDNGLLRAAVRLPLAVAPLGQPVMERAHGIRTAITEGMQRFADRAVSAVDVRFEGVNLPQERRVR
ncbi:MAG TPA: hypothetical protein H9830_13815 [Candidatus Agrococcus pullicola]|uniref:Uncharacterized protein n=1 Tax=Candidatus Agrococcus pullicola TaxID=2838429 RepID=A0A9D2CB04_9MICO|nr:hypothetical protein [Candidatus Agrococcus pullicola]